MSIPKPPISCSSPACHLVVMPLDVTHKALTTRARVEAFRALGTEVGRVAAEWADFFERFDMEKYGIGRRAAA